MLPPLPSVKPSPLPVLRFVVVFLLAAAGFARAEPPNLVLIVADDLGYGDLGCYGNESNETPHLDALAANGLRLTDFHSGGAMCSPTRASILTGRYPQTYGEQFDGALSGTAQREEGLPLAAVTIAELLHDRGYATGCFGKWHLGYQPTLFPTRQGFEIFRGLASGDGDYHSHIDRSGNPDWWSDEALSPEEGYTTDLLTRHAVAFIEANRDRPFFLYLPHLAIHFPWQGPDDPPHRRIGKSWQEDKWGIIPDPGNVAPHVKAMIESLDASVGTIVDLLRRHGLERNTLVVFTSDNGGYLTYGKHFRNISSNGPWRGQKTEVYEGGHRVPTIASWPGRIEPGVTDALAHTNDLFPTFAALAGARLGEAPLDGTDLGPLLFSGKPLPDRPLFWRSRTHAAMREGPWKLVANRNGKSAELFHLGNDPGETSDLSREHPDRLRKMQAAWDQWNRRMNQTAETFLP